MTVVSYMQRCVLLGFLVGLLSCGGGVSGTGSPVVASGTVSSFGSIIVNGIEFDTSGATILFEGQPGSVADLQLGQVVTIRGTLEDSRVMGTAATVVVDINVRGPVDRIDPTTNSLVVLGQPVLVDTMTQFGATPLNALGLGNIVEASGFVDTEGNVRATRIEKTQDAYTPGTELTVDGTITNLNAAKQTFTLKALEVHFAAAPLLNLPGNQLRNGQVVEVRSTQDVVAGVLYADQVEGKDVGIRGNPGEIVALQGIITSIPSADTFVVNGQAVRLTPETVFERGVAGDITVNVRVEVEGVFAEDGTIVGEEVEFGAGIERAGVITSVPSTDTFVLNGEIVRHTPTTIFEGGTAAEIAVNVRVKVEGFFDADGVLVATEIDFFIELEGLITSVSSPDAFVVNGQMVRHTPATVFTGGTARDITINERVEVKGFLAEDGILVAVEIEFL